MHKILIHAKFTHDVRTSKLRTHLDHSPFEAGRYHSLVIDKAKCPDDLEVTAWTEDGTIMGVRHKRYPHIQGVQFHPESIITAGGKRIVENWVKITRGELAPTI